MRIAIPVFSNDGINSKVYGHFGSAPCFIIYDTEKKNCENIDNDDQGHQHGMCNPLAGLEGRNVNAIVTGGIGLRALQRIAGSGVKVYRSAEGMMVKDVADSVESNSLQEITMDEACSQHSCG
jgi:predicted Fe-Mo cluster-binding NifX family protein